MSSEIGYLAMMLDAPLQSWGSSSRFQRRATGLHPAKSAVIGMICASMGLAKGSIEEARELPRLARLRMDSISIPRTSSRDFQEPLPLAVRRLDDFHTVEGTRHAEGGMNKDAVVTTRQYLMDARFGVIFQGQLRLLESVASALQDPRWGLWLGRKCCIPAAPLYRGLFRTHEEACRELIGAEPCQLTLVKEVERFEEGTDSLQDQPLCFGSARSSGPEERRFSMRRICLEPGHRFFCAEPDHADL